MAEMFGHEKLKVYEKSLGFVGLRSELLARIDRRVAACDHLDRGAESILLNIAHASSSWSPKDRIVYLGHANGSALECAACLDVFVARMRLTPSGVRPGKSLLRAIVSMLIAMKTTAQGYNPIGIARGRSHRRQIAAMLTSLAKAVSKDT